MTNKSVFSRYQLRCAAGEYWLLDMEQQGNVYRKPFMMNAVGAFIWKQLEEGSTREKIAMLLSDEYGVDREEALADIKQFCGQLAAEGIT